MPDVLIDARLFAGGVNLSGQTNKVDLQVEGDENDATVFEPDQPADAGWKARTGGVLDLKLGASGLWTAGDPSKVDNALWSSLGLVDVWTVVKGKGVAGDICWTFRALEAKYTLGGEHGKLAAFDAAAAGSGNVFRGKVAHPHTTARSAAGNGVDVPITGGVPAGQYLYAGLHVFSVDGTSSPTITVIVESDTTAAFSAPATRATFAAAAAPGAQLLRVAGPFTDTHYRVRWTVTGTTPSFLFAATLGAAPA